MNVHDFAGLLGHQLERQVIADVPHGSLRDPVAGSIGRQAAKRPANAGIRAVFVDVDEPERVTRSRAGEAVVEADAGNRQFDGLADGHGDLARRWPRCWCRSTASRRGRAFRETRRRPRRDWRPSRAPCSGAGRRRRRRLADGTRGHHARRNHDVQPVARAVADRKPNPILPVPARDDVEIARISAVQEVDRLGRQPGRRRRGLRFRGGWRLGRSESTLRSR